MSDPESASPPIAGHIRLAALARLTPSEVADDAVSLQLASGGVVRLNRTAAEVLALCDGTRTAIEVAAACSASREAALDFLAAALDMGWVVGTPGPRP